MAKYNKPKVKELAKIKKVKKTVAGSCGELTQQLTTATQH